MTLAGRLAPLSRLPRDARDTLFLLAVIACCIAPLAAHLPAWASAMTATLLAWRAWLAVGSRPLPGRWPACSGKRASRSPGRCRRAWCFSSWPT